MLSTDMPIYTLTELSCTYSMLIGDLILRHFPFMKSGFSIHHDTFYGTHPVFDDLIRLSSETTAFSTTILLTAAEAYDPVVAPTGQRFT